MCNLDNNLLFLETEMSNVWKNVRIETFLFVI